MDVFISRQMAIDTIHKTIYEIFGYQDGEVFTDTDKLLLMVNKLLCKKIREIPAADVVEVVMCRDCKEYQTPYCPLCHVYKVEDNDYCSYAERKQK